MRTLQFTVVAALFAASCSLPWNTNPNEHEINVAFRLQNNEIAIPSATIGGQSGTVLLATATPRTAIDFTFAKRAGLAGKSTVMRFGQRHKIAIQPVFLDLEGLADATIGADAFPHQSVTIDYKKLLVILRPVPDTSQMARYSYSGAPNVPVILNGVPGRAVVDTLLPDTMIIPSTIAGRASGRMKVSLSVGGVAFPEVDARVADVTDIHLGNRVLANFLVTVDYTRKTVALWRDPRSSAATAGASVQ